MLHSSSTCFMVVAALVSIAMTAPLNDVPENDISYLCPDILRDVDRSQRGKWTGNLIVQYTEDLVGLWLRLIFDREVSEVEVDGFQTILLEDDKYQVLVKNRNKTLYADVAIPLKLAVKYEGKKIPNLIEYRLNARRICPEQQILEVELFKGDAEGKNFLDTLILKSKHTPKLQAKCGVSPSNNNQIQPWHASLFVKHDGKEQFVCAATVIDQYHVLTAAHCVTSTHTGKAIPKGIISLYLGEDGASKSAIRANVSKLSIHPEYETGTLFNDLAILELGSALSGDSYVMPICLNDGSHTLGSVIVGYGVERKGTKQLQTEKVSEISREECVKRLPQLQNILTDESYCLSYREDNRKCIGNSGSSYISQKREVSTLQGIVSLNVELQNKECNDNSVVVITDVSRYFRWIQNHLNAAAA